MPLLLSLFISGVLLLAIDAFATAVTPVEQGARAADGRRFTVMTFNIQHGIDGTQQYNLQRAIDAIARIQPDLVGVQEVTRNHSMYKCDDQPALIADGLRRATGRTWHHVYVQEWFVNADRKCVESGRGDGPNTEGLAMFAPEPLNEVSHQTLWNSRIGLSVRTRGTGDIPIVVTHLANGSRARSEQDRTRQVGQLLPWLAAQGTPRILMGDMNAFPDHAPLVPVMETYRDAWAEAVAAGSSRGVRGGGTRVGRNSRVDYIFYTPDRRLQLNWVETVDTSALLGKHASDHHPVVAEFVVRRP